MCIFLILPTRCSDVFLWRVRALRMRTTRRLCIFVQPKKCLTNLHISAKRLRTRLLLKIRIRLRICATKFFLFRTKLRLLLLTALMTNSVKKRSERRTSFTATPFRRLFRTELTQSFLRLLTTDMQCFISLPKDLFKSRSATVIWLAQEVR